MQWAGLIASEAAVLDVAAGGGRHSRFFADLGHRVTALDRDTSGLAAKWRALIAVLADPGSGGATYIDVSDPQRPAAGEAAAH